MEGLDAFDEGGSWQKLKEEVEALIDEESQRLDKLTERVMEGVKNRLAKESAAQEKLMIRKQKRTTVQKKGIERFPAPGTQASDEGGGGEEECLVRKQKKQKTGHETKQKKRFAPAVQLTAAGLEPPPDMPEAFKNCIQDLGGTDVKLVIQKIVHATDLSPSHNRLSMTTKQVRNKFLSEAEEEETFKNKGGMGVMLIEPRLEVSEVHLAKWLIGGSLAYVFKTEWSQIVKNNADSLKPKSVVQIWSFRVGLESQLGFAMIKLRDI